MTNLSGVFIGNSFRSFAVFVHPITGGVSEITKKRAWNSTRSGRPRYACSNAQRVRVTREMSTIRHSVADWRSETSIECLIIIGDAQLPYDRANEWSSPLRLPAARWRSLTRSFTTDRPLIVHTYAKFTLETEEMEVSRTRKRAAKSSSCYQLISRDFGSGEFTSRRFLSTLAAVEPLSRDNALIAKLDEISNSFINRDKSNVREERQISSISTVINRN